MTSEVVPVTFPNRKGERLFGILHRPARPGPDDAAILLLSPGVKMRVAPHRLYTKMTDRFVALGYTVLRFDFHGLGDSAGEAPDTLLADLYGATQVGRYVDDTVDAMDWMQRTSGTSRFIAAGLCGGALTGLLAAQRDSRIVSLLSLSIPVILDGSNIDASQYMTLAQLRGTRKRYLTKLRLWDPEVWRSWKRFLTMQSHYSLIVRSLAEPLLAKLRRTSAPAPAAAAGNAATPAAQNSAALANTALANTALANTALANTAPANTVPANTAPANTAPDNTNPHFAPAFLRMVSSSRRVLLVFAETDRLLWDFEAKFMQRHQAAIDRYNDYYDVHIVPRANHIFSFSEWQAEMLDRACQWLESGVRVPVSAGARRG